MSKEELTELIVNGENSEVEFKEDNIRPEQLAKEIVAFANGYGGRIILGVDDNGMVIGIKKQNLEEWVMDTVCGHYVHPLLIPKYEEMQWNKKNRVAIVSVLAGTAKPYVVRTKNREDIYIRIGSISKLATREQIVRLSATGGLMHLETMPISGTNFNNLDLARLENYFQFILAEANFPKTQAEWELRLEDMGFMQKSEVQGYVCTIAGLVLFGITPRRYLRQAGIRIEVFNTLEKNYNALLDVVLDGPMVARFNISQAGFSEIIDEGLVEKTARTLYPFITAESDKIDKGFRRSIKHYYPWAVIRELVLNALAHRDWSRSTDIEICCYSDRFEIISPGSLPNSMTVEKMIAGRRTPRNNIIMEVLRDYQYVDARGMGIRNKVIPLMKQFNGTEPYFEATDDYLRTVIYNKGAIIDPENDPNIFQEGLNYDPKRRYFDPNKTLYDPNKLEIDLNKVQNDPNKPEFDPNMSISDRILYLIKNNPKISYKEMAEITGKSIPTIKRSINKLKAEGLIKRSGSPRGGKWILAKDENS